MNVFLLSGLPRSGKTTSMETLKKYLEDNGIDYLVIENTNHRTRKSDAIHLIAAELYQSILENKSPNLIIEGPFLNVFDREVIFDKLDDALRINKDLSINLIAIQHNRSNRFVFNNNKLEGDRTVYPDKVIINALNTYQQPIREEGFGLIYNVNGDRYLELAKFTGLVHRIDNTFPVLSSDSDKEDHGEACEE